MAAAASTHSSGFRACREPDRNKTTLGGSSNEEGTWALRTRGNWGLIAYRRDSTGWPAVERAPVRVCGSLPFPGTGEVDRRGSWEVDRGASTRGQGTGDPSVVLSTPLHMGHTGPREDDGEKNRCPFHLFSLIALFPSCLLLSSPPGYVPRQRFRAAPVAFLAFILATWLGFLSRRGP